MSRLNLSWCLLVPDFNHLICNNQFLRFQIINLEEQDIKVTFSNSNTCPTVRWLLIVLISCVFLLFGSSNNCFAQSNNTDIIASFVKKTDSLKTSGLYFNILKISNNTKKAIIGNVTFNGPENWKIISFPSDQTIIEPGDSALIPVRVSPATDALGGISYIISGTFKTSTNQISANTYLALPSITKWDFTINKNQIYFTENSPNTSFQIHLSNKGNTAQLIRLDLEMGKLLELPKSTTNEFVEYIQLPAFKDTTITHTVVYQSDLSYSDRIRYERNWKESALKATASSELVNKSAVILFHKLNSTFINQRAQSASPLNVEYQINNLMSSQEPRSNIRLYGNILFKKSREIQYYAGVNNLSHDFRNTDNFDVNQQLMYSLRYIDLKNSIELGYNIYGGNLHTINGRGIAGTYSANKRSKIAYTLTQNPYSDNIGGHLGYSSAIGKVTFNTNVIHEENVKGSYSATSASVGLAFRVLKYHSLSLQFLGSQANYSQPQRDTTLLGFSYRVNYGVRLKKFDFRISALNSVHNYIRNSGLQQYYIDSKYILTDNASLTLYGNRQYYSTTRYPYNFDNLPNYNSADYLRLTASIAHGNLNYQMGPDYNGSMRQLFNSSTGYNSEFRTYQPGVWGAVTIKIGENRILTPNVTVNNLRFYYKTDDPALLAYSSTKNIYYSVGVNYFDRVWRMNAYYTSGSTSDLYRSVQLDTDPILTKSIQFRPSYENFFFDQKVKLSAYVNYAYYMPSGRENISYNIKYDHFFKNGFSLSFIGFLYSNSRNDKELGAVSTKDLNFIVGFRKSFNIQQPRLKYYNYKALFFNDLDGNKIKTDNEPPVSDVLVNIERNRDIAASQSYIPETELISDVNGEIAIENLPKDDYKLKFTPLVNLKSLYFLNGSEQSYLNDKNRTMYVPLAESYKIKGKIIVIRDPNSSEGAIDLSGVRITAKSLNGETYSALTDNFGAFIINVTSPDKFIVEVNNVFGEQFSIENDEMEVQFVQNRTVNLDFTFEEKKRSIQFENGMELFKFSGISGDSEASIPETNVESSETKTVAAIEQTKNYSIQLAASKIYRKPSFYKDKFKLKEEVLYTEENGEFKYFTGNYPSIESANADIKKLGVTGFPVVVDELQLKKEVVKEIPKATVIGTVSDKNTQNNAPKQVSVPKLVDEAAIDEVPVKTNQNTVVPKQDVTPKVIETAKEIPTKSTQGVVRKQEIPRVGENATPQQIPVKTDQTVVIPRQNVTQEVSEPIKEVPVKSTQNVAPKQGVPKVIENATMEKVPVKTTQTAVPNQETNVNASEKSILKEASKVKLIPLQVAQKLDTLPKGQYYSIQLDALKAYRNPTYYNTKYNLKDEVLCVEENGVFKYFTGSYNSIDAARGDIAKYGMSGYIILVDTLQSKKEDNAKK